MTGSTTEKVSIPAPGQRSGTPSAPAGETAGREEPGPPGTAVPGGPAEAFDLLYTRHAEPLFRQVCLLTGDRRLAERSVRHAFRLAWERWPEVAVDRNPAGWVRAAAHDHALSPWHRLDPRRRLASAPFPAGGEREDREDREERLPREALETLAQALLELPPSYRRTLLLHDGLGLGAAETAAESESSTAAAAGRLMHAREALGEYVPALRRVEPERRRRIIRALLEGLAAAWPVPALPPARAVREGGERLAQRRTGAVIGATSVLVAAAVFGAATGPAGHTPPDRSPAVSGHSPEDGAADG
ncbi:hypothetical protein CUT44_26915 [Streptomyces carminius]|uniref:RNA polymerase sigma factor 70 region 4 type 2 domain-containing protein n=1 Tax=Streptomyces carminius TaxID=2665496 RepID=A0A2M8LS47_9ACTN|nr:sigma factor-like helix-turn-helix DNA-binding protein [Streptomyces carminius]PJE94786.1 hypothetical protein CUT44_26915 [Streptomyces carminius]